MPIKSLKREDAKEISFLGIYYEKVFKKSINCYWRLLDLSYGFSIWKRNV